MSTTAARRTFAAALALTAAGAWYAFRPEKLFTTRTVDEPPPAAAMTTGALPAAARFTLAGNVTAAASAEQPALAGRFRNGAHETSGAATVLELGGGRRVLRLSDFSTSDGPAVHVLLVAAPDVTDNATVTKAGSVDLGALKGTKGNQNYEIPASVDLAKYRTVTIWCSRFSVNFGSAPLAAAAGAVAPGGAA